MDEHAAAVLARLDANPNMVDATNGATPNLINVYYGTRKPSAPVRTPPYVVFYLNVPYESKTKLNSDVTDETWHTIYTHSCGNGHTASDIVRKQVRAQLLDHKLSVAGWNCDRIYHESGSQPDWDDTSGILLVDAVDQWDYRSEPTG